MSFFKVCIDIHFFMYNKYNCPFVAGMKLNRGDRVVVFKWLLSTLGCLKTALSGVRNVVQSGIKGVSFYIFNCEIIENSFKN